MPPASRGLTYSAFRYGFPTHVFRPNSFQQRSVARLSVKPTLPPPSAIKPNPLQTTEAKLVLKAKEKDKWTSYRPVLSRISLPPTARRLLQRLSPPPWVRRWTWRLFFLGPPIAVFLMSFPWTTLHVNGASMVPFFNVNSSSDLPAAYRDIVLVQKSHSLGDLSHLFRLPKSKLERGQIVVFYTPHDPHRLAVKRVIGVPGDRVTPLPGYLGGNDETSVVIPYNHIWVEGDANSRDKSVDSNHFGPISQNLVFGHVLGVFTPWHWPVWLTQDGDDYPAKRTGRVEKDVVRSARLDPDQEARQAGNPFQDGTAALELAMIRRNREALLRKMRDGELFQRYRSMYALARKEVEQGDAVTRPVADGLVEELEIAFESVGLNKDGSRIAPAVNRHGQDVESERRLQEYLARHRTA